MQSEKESDMSSLFLEAESFSHLGGWIVETQSVSSMGSPYLMAHGIGTPVADAETEVDIPEDGNWHIHVRTRDWSRVWKRGSPAGRFQVKIDRKTLDAVLGANGPEWSWQNAGNIRLKQGMHRIALHDLTGFNGRCDALYLTTEEKDIPPDTKEELADFRRKKLGITIEDDPEFYDLIVCGGGYAGICTALAAKYTGSKVLLIQDRAVLGGCNSSEIRVWLGGLTKIGKYPELGHISHEIGPIRGTPGDGKSAEIFEDTRKELLFHKGSDLLLNEMLHAVETDPKNPRKITAVITKNVMTGKETRRKSHLFSDCTGDAVLARFCGCETMYGREGRKEYQESLAPETRDRQVMGHSVLWETVKRDKEVSFPEIDWGIEFNEQNAIRRTNCCWDWEAGQYRDQAEETERIRDYGLMTALCNWSWLKNHAADRERWKPYDLCWISPIGGKRESYRVYGDYVLTQNDIEKKIPHDDATASITWSIDLHYPDPENEERFGEAFQSCAYHRGIHSPYEVPYRCLYAKDMENLFLGGRIISVTHAAFSCIRVMRTLGMLGEVVGMAASLCRKHNCSPREIYEIHLEKLKEMMHRGVKLREPHGYWPDDSESFHFMRPLQSVGNETEDVWIRFPGKNTGVVAIPPSIWKCIETLKITLKTKLETIRKQ